MRLVGGWGEDPLWASVYDWMVEHPVAGGAMFRAGMGSPLGLLHEAAEEIAGLPAGGRVLDVPCGGGLALRGLRVDQDVSYVGVDISDTMLRRTTDAARRRGTSAQVEVRRADVGALPFDDAGFDLVVSLTGLHCFPDPPAAIAEMARVLRPGGVLRGSTLLNDAGLRWAPMRLGGRVGKILGPGVTGEQVVRLLAAEGVSDLHLHRSGALGYFRGVKRA